MPFGMQSPQTADFADIIKYDANAGRLFRIDYNPDTREKVPVDITTPPPKVAIDFGSLEVGWGRFSATGPEYHIVPEGQLLPAQPLDKDEKGKLLFRSVFRLKAYGKILLGLREWASSANCVLEAVEDLYQKFRAAPEAASGKIPIVELTKTIPIKVGRGTRQRVLYAPCFAIVGWTERVPAMGDRTVPPPTSAAAKPDNETPPSSDGGDLEDDIPF